MEKPQVLLFSKEVRQTNEIEMTKTKQIKTKTKTTKTKQKNKHKTENCECMFNVTWEQAYLAIITGQSDK